MVKSIYLVRHCHASGQEPQAELTDKGREQAEELMRFFEKRKVNHIISSPFKRAIQSIQPTAECKEINVEIDSRLAEHRLISEDVEDWIERFKESFQEMDLKMAGGQSSLEVAEKAVDLLQAATDGTILITHRNTMGLLLMQIVGVKGLKEWTAFSHPDVYEVEVNNNSYDVKRIWNPKR